MRAEWRNGEFKWLVLLELLTFSFSVLFMLADSEHTGSTMVYPRFYRGRNGQSNSSVPMKLLRSRKLRRRKGRERRHGRRFPALPFVSQHLANRYAFRSISSLNTPSAFNKYSFETLSSFPSIHNFAPCHDVPRNFNKFQNAY